MNAEHAGHRRKLSTSQSSRSAGGLLGLLVAGMALCCGLPLLLGAGVALGAAGLALGSGVVVIVAGALVVWAWRRRRAARKCGLSELARDEGRPARPNVRR